MELDVFDFGKTIEREYPESIFVIRWEDNENGNNPPTFFWVSRPEEFWRLVLAKYSGDLSLAPSPDEDQTLLPKPNIAFDDQREELSICYGCEDNFDRYKIFSRYNEIKAALV